MITSINPVIQYGRFSHFFAALVDDGRIGAAHEFATNMMQAVTQHAASIFQQPVEHQKFIEHYAFWLNMRDYAREYKRYSFTQHQARQLSKCFTDWLPDHLQHLRDELQRLRDETKAQ